MGLKVKTTRPPADSREPVRNTGILTAAAGLAVVLAARWLDVDPEILAGVAVVLAPVIAAEVARLRAYAPATVAKLLAARGVHPPESGR